MDAVLLRKLREIETLPIQEVYKLPEFKRDKHRVYNDALGMTSPEEKRMDQERMAKRCADPSQNILAKMYSADRQQESNVVAPPVGQLTLHEMLLLQTNQGQCKQEESNVDDLNTESYQNSQTNAASSAYQNKRINLMPARKDDFSSQRYPTNSTNMSMVQVPQSFANFREVLISVKYTTQFGEELCLVGSHPYTGSWNSDNGGLKMKWSDGHLWTASLPLNVIRTSPQNLIIEFKFVILQNGKTKHWENGQNHQYNGNKIHQIMQSPDVCQHMQQRQGKDLIKIGTYDGQQGDLNLHGTNEERNVPDSAAKVKLSYCVSKGQLKFHQYFQF